MNWTFVFVLTFVFVFVWTFVFVFVCKAFYVKAGGLIICSCICIIIWICICVQSKAGAFRWVDWSHPKIVRNKLQLWLGGTIKKLKNLQEINWTIAKKNWTWPKIIGQLPNNFFFFQLALAQQYSHNTAKMNWTIDKIN